MYRNLNKNQRAFRPEKEKNVTLYLKETEWSFSLYKFKPLANLFFTKWDVKVLPFFLLVACLRSIIHFFLVSCAVSVFLRFQCVHLCVSPVPSLLRALSANSCQFSFYLPDFLYFRNLLNKRHLRFHINRVMLGLLFFLPTVFCLLNAYFAFIVSYLFV